MRDIHRGCRKALRDYLTVEPILGEPEDAPVTVGSDFDPAEIRLTGNVQGSPPFRGVLKHHGWRVKSVQLPALPGLAGRRVGPGAGRPRWRSPDMSRYVVGIDLGTTNSALAYADTKDAAADDPPAIRSLPIPQVVAAGDVAERPVLPSFLYLPGPKEFPAGSLDLPWAKERRVASSARSPASTGRRCPARLVGSAKSWLSHPGVDRKGPILPWNAPERRRQGLARRGVDRLPGPPPRRLERQDRRQVGRRAAANGRTCFSPCRPRSTPPRAS